MEAILQTIAVATFSLLSGRTLAFYRYDPVSDCFVDVYRLKDGAVYHHATPGTRRGGVTEGVLRSGQPLVVQDAGEMAGLSDKRPQNSRSFVAVPVFAHGAPTGVLYLNDAQAGAITEEDVALAQNLAGQIGAYQEGHELEKPRAFSMVRVLAATVDAKDPYTQHHSINVAYYARRLARQMGLSREQVDLIDMAGLLHDIGKVGIPDQVLNKPGRLTPDEWALVKAHPSIGANILANAPELARMVPVVRHHHERYDGTGYPDGLRGDEIPIGAQVISLADAFDAMTSRRVYRDAMPLDAALAEIRRCSGTQFHPAVVEAFEELVLKARFAKEPWLTKVGQVQVQEVAAVPSVTGSALRPQPGPERDPLDLLDNARTLQHEADLLALCERGGDLVAHALLADAALMYLYDAASGCLDLAWSGGTIRGQWLVDACRREGARRLSDGLVGWAVSTGQVLCEPDIRLDPRWPYQDPVARPASVLILPIPGHRRAVGAVQLVTFEPDAFSPEDARTGQIFAALFGQALDRAQLAAESREALWTDTLTGVKSANYLGPFLDRCLENPTGETMAVAFFDGDNLKAANDRFGHESGNRLIRHIATSLAGATRPQDVLIRYAGDEFILFMPATTVFEARPVLERMRLAVQAAPVQLPQGPFRVSVSGGVAEVQPGQDPFVALRAAEREMYRAKREGKNRVAGGPNA